MKCVDIDLSSPNIDQREQEMEELVEVVLLEVTYLAGR